MGFSWIEAARVLQAQASALHSSVGGRQPATSHVATASVPHRRQLSWGQLQKRLSVILHGHHHAGPTTRTVTAAAAGCDHEQLYRRKLVAGVVLAAAACVCPPVLGPAHAQDDGGSSRPSVDSTITDKIYLDVGMCSTSFRPDRRMGDKSILCEEPEPAGRIVIGLFGHQVPHTVKNFLAVVQANSLAGTTFHKVVPGSYIQAGRQGSLRMGEVQAPFDLEANPETLQSNAFRMEHTRPGTVSLSLSENDDEPLIKQRPQYRNTEFLITTGPGPATFLDGQNVVFGRVLSGIDTVVNVANVPTFQVDKRIRWVNEFAGLIGDERAAKARARWTKPQKPVVITACGVL